MKDTLFVQFYSQWKIRPNTFLWGISNGFSDTYDLCKSKGDFYWVKHNYDRQTYTTKDVIDDCKKEELPIKKGNVFVSATTTTHAYQAYIWAEKYPNINFIVGGPSIITGTFTYNSLPKNLIFIEKSVEQYFGVPDFSYGWKLDLPKQTIQDDLDIFFTYSLNSKCYWKKCIFCKFNEHDNRERSIIDFKFKDNVNTNKIKRVFLYTPSMSAELMMNLIPKLSNRNDLRYVLFMRSGKKENEALEEVLKKCSEGEGPSPDKILFEVGVEFPGNRMLQYMKKGTTTNNILNTLKIIKKYKGQIAMMFMLGWPNLIKQDIEELKDFVKKVPEYDNGAYKVIKISKTMARVNTPLHEMVEKKNLLTVGPFYSGFGIKLTKEDILINKEARNILLSIGNSIDYYTRELSKEIK